MSQFFRPDYEPSPLIKFVKYIRSDLNVIPSEVIKNKNNIDFYRKYLNTLSGAALGKEWIHYKNKDEHRWRLKEIHDFLENLQKEL